jgi:hypothetical protein
MKKEIDPATYDKETTLVNFSNSVLEHYGLKTFHPAVSEITKAMEGHKKIAVFLFDGLSEYNLHTYPHTTKFMTSHKLMTIHSVNPATTVACTTAFLSGKFPIEDGWFGWSLYFEEYGYPIDVFTNVNSITGAKIEGANIMKTEHPYTPITNLLNEAGVKSKALYRFPVEDALGPHNFREMQKMAGDFFDKEGGQFLYGYWNQPDKYLHKFGVKSWHVHLQIAEIAHFVKKFTKKHPDVEVFTFADHGLIDVQYRDMAAFPDLIACLSKPLTFEGRTCNFFVKEGSEQTFKTLFEEHFGDNFVLLSRQDVLSKGYFGEGEAPKFALSFLGDFVAVATGKDLLVNSADKPITFVHKGHHAGATKEERDVMLGCYNR